MSLLAHAVSDRRRLGLSIDALVEWAARAARQGVAAIQVRERDLPDRDLVALVRRIRAVAPAGFVIGRSVHDSAEVDAAVADGACDYLLFGTVFPSAGKPAGHRVAGIAALREVCRRAPVPVIAIGGIEAARLPLIEDAGAAGFAGVGMFR